MNVNEIQSSYRSSPAQAESDIDLPAIEGDTTRRILRITTRKYEGRGLVSAAQVLEIEEGMTRFAIFGDYRAIIRSQRLKATERNVRAEHALALEAVPALLEAAHAYYAARQRNAMATALPAPV